MLFPGESVSMSVFGELGRQWLLGQRWTIACSFGAGWVYQLSFDDEEVYPDLNAGPPFSLYDLYPFLKVGVTVGFRLQ
jgi:glutathione S-transferase